MRLKDEDYAIILIEIAEVKEEISVVMESLHNQGRKFGVCLFLIPKATLMHLVSNANPPYSIPAMTTGVV